MSDTILDSLLTIHNWKRWNFEHSACSKTISYSHEGPIEVAPARFTEEILLPKSLSIDSRYMKDVLKSTNTTDSFRSSV